MEKSKLIASGSSANVFIRKSRITGKTYIIKVLENTSDAIKEVKILQYIKDKCKPYLICIEFIHFSALSKAIYLEYIPNTFELYSYITNNQSQLTIFSRFVILRRLLEGLAYLHSLGVVHKDIKDNNIIINPNTLEIYYIDYGAACIKTDIVCLKRPKGTIPYMSPEIKSAYLQRKSLPEENVWNICKKSDVWSLGITFIYICFPYVNELINKHFREILRPLGKNISDKKDVINLFSEIIGSMLIINWENRPSALEVLKKMNTVYTNRLIFLAFPNMVVKYKSLAIQKIALNYAQMNTVSTNTKIFPGYGKTI
jgi:serine/threonine protein kinase